MLHFNVSRSGWVFLILFLLMTVLTFAQQKRPFETADYPGMPTISKKGISDNGQFVWYVIAPMQYGDPVTVVHNLKTNRIDSLLRCKNVWFASDGAWMAWTREPEFVQVRAARKRDPKEAEKLNDTLFVRNLNSKEYLDYVYDGVKTVLVPQEFAGERIAALLKVKEPEPPKSDSVDANGEETPREKPSRSGDKKKKEEKRMMLVVLNPASGEVFTDSLVVTASWSPNGKTLAYTVQPVDTLPAQQLFLLHEKYLTPVPRYLSGGMLKFPVFSFNDDKLAILEQPDTADDKSFSYLVWNSLTDSIILKPQPPAGMVFNPHQAPFFLEKNNNLVLYYSSSTVKPLKDSLTEDERYSVDVWKWDDPYIQSQQLKELDKEKKRGYAMLYNPEDHSTVIVEDSILRRSNLSRQNTNSVILLWNEQPYAIESTWKSSSRSDLWMINTLTEEKKLVFKASDISVFVSPDDAYLVWYDQSDSTWKATGTLDLSSRCLTCQMNVSFYNDEYDNPGPAPSYGISGWGDEGRYILLNSKYDIWKIDLQGNEPPVCITSAGKENDSLVYRIQPLENRKFSYREKDLIMLTTFNEKTKGGGFATLQYHKPGKPVQLLSGPFRYSALEKARNTDRMVWRRERFDEFPEVWTEVVGLKNPLKLSSVGKAYEGFYSGTAQLVHWKAYGRDYEGILHLPENKDGFEKLPMIVTFYERSSDGLYGFNPFVPSRSVINTAYYLSHGYAVFEPDICYPHEGEPGFDAVTAVESGTRYVLSLGMIDPTRVGIQGQSWGGYQVAFIITQSNMFAAAMAGAAVSNMTSAYGGIRWESGKARMFQYEDGQSRLGIDLWQGPTRYFSNSPLFYADSVKTPLLMMHNDNDGAVPWSQSVEYYLALRRLQKPCWLLVYNNEAHNLEKWPNRVDLSIRMMQFFNHFLKDQPEPEWMDQGRPALLKGVEDGYRFSE
jgi:dipeptidyl aminopeptidase/acylaminoacyl peptidase